MLQNMGEVCCFGPFVMRREYAQMRQDHCAHVRTFLLSYFIFLMLFYDVGKRLVRRCEGTSNNVYISFVANTARDNA
jgi:hypothetical protein